MNLKSLLLKGISSVLVVLLLAITSNLRVEASNFDFNTVKFQGNNPIAGTNQTFGSTLGELYTTSSSRVRFDWTQASNETYHIVYLSGSTPVPFTASPITSPFDITTWGGLPEGVHTIYVSGVNVAKRSHDAKLVIDNTAPQQASGLALNISGTPVVGAGSARSLTLTWSAANDIVPASASITTASQYEVSYNYNGITETFFPNRVSGTTFAIELPTQVPDTTITFTVYSIDAAGNRNSLANATNQITYVLNTTLPNSPTNLILKNVDGDTLTGSTGGRFGDLSFTRSTSSDVTSYEISYRIGSAAPVVLSSGSNEISYTGLFATGFNPAQGSNITLQVVAVDSAGNRSTALSRSIVYDSVAPTFVIEYLNTAVTPAVFASASGVVINQTNIKSLVVTNALNDIQSYVVERNNVQVASATGTASELQTYLRGLTQNGNYRVIVRDAAFNRASFLLDVRVGGPRLPTNRNIQVNGSDERDEAGIQATVTVDFDPSPDIVLNASFTSGTYRLFVDGRLIEGVNPVGVGGRIRMTFLSRTAFYGDVQSIYVIQAVDQFGNVVNYNNRTDFVIRDRMRPEARVVQTSSNATSITAVIDLLDNNRVLTLAGARAELYNGTTLVTSIPLTVGRETYTFLNLRERQTNYNIRIVGSYTWQGSTVNNEVLNEGTRYAIDTLSTSPDVTATMENIRTTDTTLSLDVVSTKNVAFARFIDVILYSGVGPYSGNPIKTERIELPQNQSTQVSPVTFTGLGSGVNYHIQLREGGFIIATGRAITNLAVPESTFSVFETRQDEVTATINITNTNAATAFVFQGNTLVSTQGILLEGSSNRFTIPNLLPNIEYNLKVIATYQVFTETPNGSVVSNTVNGAVIGEYTFRTAKRMLTGSFPIVDVLDDEVLFTVSLDDPDNALVRGSVALYLGQTFVREIAIDRGSSNLKFENLQSNSDYTMSIHITYNLQDGKGEQTRQGALAPSALTNSFVIRRFKTIKTLPSVNIVDVIRTDKTLTLTVEPIDPDAAFVTGTVRIFSLTESPPLIRSETLLRTPFHRETPQTFTFTGLEPDTAYRIEVDLDYNLEDGRNVRVYKPHNQQYRTRPSISADILGVQTTSTTVVIDIELFDYTAATVLGKVFRGSNQVGTAVQLRNGLNRVEFTDLDPSTSYRVVFDYNNGAQLLTSRDVATRRAVALTVPVPTLTEPTVSERTALIKVDLQDPDNTIQSRVEISICDQESSACTNEIRTASQVLAGTEVQLPYDNQSITIRFTYDIDGENQVIEVPTIVRLSSPEPEPVPEPTPEPEPSPEPQPPREPLNVNLGVVIASVVGAVAVGFVGLFLVQFRRFYVR